MIFGFRLHRLNCLYMLFLPDGFSCYNVSSSVLFFSGVVGLFARLFAGYTFISGHSLSSGVLGRYARWLGNISMPRDYATTDVDAPAPDVIRCTQKATSREGFLKWPPPRCFLLWTLVSKALKGKTWNQSSKWAIPKENERGLWPNERRLTW